jgi:hypothetical protein
MRFKIEDIGSTIMWSDFEGDGEHEVELVGIKMWGVLIRPLSGRDKDQVIFVNDSKVYRVES